MGRNVLVIGAGRSSSSLIRYLLQNAQEMDVKILVGDMDVDLAKSKVNGHPRGEAFLFNAMEEEARRKVISSS